VKGVYIEKEFFFELGLYTESGKIKRRTFAFPTSIPR